jgi:hypothetical protein
MLNCWSLRSRFTRKSSAVARAGLIASMESFCGTISVVAYGVGENDGTGVGYRVGICVGVAVVGLGVGVAVGASEGGNVGIGAGIAVGAGVGADVIASSNGEETVR